MRCLGRKKTTSFRRRCTNDVHWWMPFCWRHRFQLVLALGALIGVGVGIAGFSGLSLPDFSRSVASSPLALEAIGNSRLEDDEEVCVAFALPFIDHPSCVNLPLVIRNAATKRVSNVAVTLVLNSEYVHVLPAGDANEPDVMGAVSPDDRERTTSHTGTLSVATVKLPWMDGQTAMMLGEPLVWTRQLLTEIKAGHAPIVDLNVRINADKATRSSFTLRIQAVQEVSTGKGTPTHAPMPFSDFNGRIIVISSEMGTTVYQGMPCYVAKGLTSKNVALKR